MQVLQLLFRVANMNHLPQPIWENAVGSERDSVIARRIDVAGEFLDRPTVTSLGWWVLWLGVVCHAAVLISQQRD